MVGIECIIILTLTLFSLAHGEPESNCSTEGIIVSSRNSQICCNGEVYTTKRHYKFDYSCNVEPKEDSLTYEDSMWLAYDCNVRKWLESASIELTLKSYVTLMSQLLPEERQDVLWAKKMSDRVSTEGGDEQRKITIIKKYVTEYFRAVKEVCTYGEETSETSNFTTVEKGRMEGIMALMQPEIHCKNGDIPYYMRHNFPGNANHDGRSMAVEDAEIGKCKDTMRDYASKVSSSQIINNATSFCFLIIYEDFDLSQLKAQVNFESIITSFFPKFWSKSAKDVGKKAVFKILKRDYSKDVPEFTDLVPEMIAVTETNLKNALQPEEVIAEQDLLVKVFLTHHIYNVCNYVRYYIMCQKGGEPFE